MSGFPWGSVRLRTTAVATLLAAIVLTVASVVIVRLVERDLIDATETTLDEALESASEQLTEATLGKDTFFPVASEAGELFVGVFEEADGLLFGALIAEGFEEPIGELVVDARTGEVIDIVGLDGEPLPEELIPFELDGVFETKEVEEGLFLLGSESLKDVRDSVEAVKDALTIIVPAVTVLIGLATWFLVGRALRPVHAITEQVESISQSTLSERVPVPASRDEIAEMATVMNHMLDRLQIGSLRQREFVADASHELRSPLSTIRAAAEVASVEEADGRWGRVAEDVLAESERMELLIADLLDLARLDEQRSAAPLELLDLRSVVDSTLNFVAEGGLQLDAYGQDVTVVGVGSQLDRLVRNLVENACRHAESRVAVQVSTDGPVAVLTVDDDGPGVAEADRQRIFERFVRLDAPRTRRAGGSGLGLALVAAIVERHGGEVSAHESPLGGARFVCRLPAEGPVSAGQAVQERSQ